MPDISNDAYKTNGVSRIVQYDWSFLASHIDGQAVYRPSTISIDNVNTTPKLSVYLSGITTPASVFSVGDTFTISGAPTELTVGDNTWLPSGSPDINTTHTITGFYGIYIESLYTGSIDNTLRSSVQGVAGTFDTSLYYLKNTHAPQFSQFDYGVIAPLTPSVFNFDYTADSGSEHAEAVLACVAHNDYGAATKSNIYIMSKDQFPNSDVFIWKFVKAFHENKNNNNPTICVNSFGTRSFSRYVKKVNFRETDYTTKNGGKKVFESYLGYTFFENGFGIAYQNRVPYPLEVQAALTSMTDAGVIHVCSAGNQKHKLDHANGIDFNNTVTTVTRGSSSVAPEEETRYYCRPALHNPDTILVGNLDSDFGGAVSDTTRPPAKGDFYDGEAIEPTSNRGPAVDCYVGGTRLSVPIKQNGASTFLKTTGTSFSSPTLAGMIAAVASKYPTTTPAQMKKYIREIAVSDVPLMNADIRPSTSNGDFGDRNHFELEHQMGGNAKITYIDPSLPYDPSTITDTTINYKDDTLRGVYNY